MSLRRGWTTGTCAAAAAKAAALALSGAALPAEVEVPLPGGRAVRLPVLGVHVAPDGSAATAAVRKDAGDDPDVTDGLEVRATLSWSDGPDVVFLAGEGVGTVTKPGLQIPPGQPAINPIPRRMIAAAVRQVTPRGVRVELAIPGGREVAAQTFNPRLGIEGGLSILGTTGIVRPYCRQALRDALRCSLDVAAACGARALVAVPGNIGARAARARFKLTDEQLIEVGNAWDALFVLLSLRERSHMAGHAGGVPLAEREAYEARHVSGPFQALLLLGHPGKLAKLAAGQWDTHSAHSRSALEIVQPLCEEVLHRPPPESPTVEGLLAALVPEERARLAERLAQRIRSAVARRLGGLPVAVALIDMAGQGLAADGDLAPWQ